MQQLHQRKVFQQELSIGVPDLTEAIEISLVIFLTPEANFHTKFKNNKNKVKFSPEDFHDHIN